MFMFMLDEGGGRWLLGCDYPTLAWPKHGHLPGGSTTMVMVVGKIM